MKDKYIFILQYDNNKISADYKEEVDNNIKYFEDHGKELPFKVIGRIKEVTEKVLLEQFSIIFEWYEEKPSHTIIAMAIEAIIDLIS